jgi:hypothetical protein
MGYRIPSSRNSADHNSLIVHYIQAYLRFEASVVQRLLMLVRVVH